MKVRCPFCREIYLETTEAFDPNRTANGPMFRLTEQYGPNGYNWSVFPPDEWIIQDALECPGCLNPIVGADGKVNPENLIADDGRPGKAIVLPLNYAKEGGPVTAIKTPFEFKPNEAHVCTECGKSCKNAGSLANHMKSHDKKE